MVGKLKIDMQYNPKIVDLNGLPGLLTLSYELDNSVEELFHHMGRLDMFVRWYCGAVTGIFADLPKPFFDDKSFAEGWWLYHKLPDSERNIKLNSNPNDLNSIWGAFPYPEVPHIFLVKRGDHGEISLSEEHMSKYHQFPRFKDGPWAYNFDLKEFVTDARNEIKDFISEVEKSGKPIHPVFEKRFGIWLSVLEQFPIIE